MWSADMPAAVAAETSTLFARLLGAGFGALPRRVQRLHEQAGTVVYTGQVEVTRGAGWLARCCAWATRLPPAGRGPIEVEIVASAASEHWTRRVGRHAMRSRLWARDGLLCERLGLVTFGFRLGMDGDTLTWRVARVRSLGLPLPARWFTGVVAREGDGDGCYTFDVRATLPLAGLLVHYRGWLHVAP